ncbi:MAG: chromosome segregation protein SMC [Eubacteriales bacterium]
MYLKSIEVYGFKSFANKIKFQFHNGITGIVGPNGSGKSNVADAVRWVLGEQKIKQLRGATMQDVIFSGTETRKPVGYAYVSITLDNTDRQLTIDYDEVTVGRRIYRSGESEYSINGTVCRLKDVSELFYDTGIGKEGYSIIGQGQIDKILSGKPEERRELFDEAAGIVKFKRRKSASIKKLEDEKQNLLRVKDILSELEKQTKPLERQSEVAKEFLKKKDVLKTLDVNMFLLENKQINEKLQEAEGNFIIASNDLESSNRKYVFIKEEYQSMQERIEQLDIVIENIRKSVTDTSVIAGKLEGEKNVLQEQIKSMNGNEAQLQSRLFALLKDVEEKEINKQEVLSLKINIDQDFTIVEREREQAREQLLALQSQIEQLNSQMEAAKNTIIQALNERAGIRSKMGSFETMIEQIQIRKSTLTAQLLQAKTDTQEHDILIQTCKEEFKQIGESITDLNEAQEKVDKELLAVKNNLILMDQKIRDAQSSYLQEKSKLDALSNLTERYEGYGGSVKKVMEQKDAIAGIVGVVADIIKVDKKYEVAIETALGGNIQNIVTKDEEIAKKLIQHLKNHKAGRATFLPLTSIHNQKPFKQQAILKENGVLGLASDLVHTEDVYQDVATAMLGRIVVVEHIDQAVKLAKEYRQEVRMVTLEGELLIPGGAISGGAFKNNSNLLSRRREMDELKNKVEQHKAKITMAEEEIVDTKEKRTALRLELENIKTILQEKFIAQNTARLNIISAEEKREEAASHANGLQVEGGDIEQQIVQMQKQKEDTLVELKQSEVLEKEMEDKITIFQHELKEKREEESIQTTSLSEKEVAVEKILQSQGFEQQNIDRIHAELLHLLEEKEKLTDEIEKNTKELEEKKHDILEIEKTISTSQGVQSDSEKELQENVALREELSAKQKDFFNKREEIAKQQSLLDKEAYRLQNQVEKHKESMQAQINYMWEEYEITLRDAAILRNPEMEDLIAMKKSVVSLKEEIKKLGNVNVNAIEEYKELMERYTDLKTQHDDLVEAQEILEAIVVDLDSAMRKQFKEKFGQIAKEFNTVFGELFGGGKGTLELMEGEDMLEAGIRIIAQPPGKKLQNMMQLSGGEKALTAISLLFAIQNLKPSPFCLLDEIEAALDENNVARFSKYLNKLTKSTQFIVITHRRGTMEKADRLYGITMQEKGVSTLVSVDLIKEKMGDNHGE